MVLAKVGQKRVSGDFRASLDPARFCVLYTDGEGVCRADDDNTLLWFLARCEKWTSAWTVFLLCDDEAGLHTQEYCRELARTFLPQSAQT